MSSNIVLSNAGVETLLQYANDCGLKGAKDAKVSKAIHKLITEIREGKIGK